MIPKELLDEIRCGFALPLDGIHGEAHWARVHQNGLRLAEQTGADVEIVELFAYLHDSKRLDDGWDSDHGRRAAVFIRGLDASLFALPEEKLDLLVYACAHHSEGQTAAEVTIQTCWDADRLDLGRIRIKPDPQYLCTSAAKDLEIIEWAYWRGRNREPR